MLMDRKWEEEGEMEITACYNNMVMQSCVTPEQVMYKLPVRFIPERIGW